MASFVSLSELQTPERHKHNFNGDPPISWDLSLPAHLDLERIQLNASRLSLVHKIGAFSGSLVKQYDGEVSEHFNITGINPDGSAVAGKSTSKTVDKNNSNLIDDPRFPSYDTLSGKPIAVHKINRPEAVQDVIQQKDNGETDEQAWAKVLDAHLRDSFRTTGEKNLILRSNKYDRIVNYFTAAAAADGLLGTLPRVIQTGNYQHI